ncbi:hypothetical protein [Thiohalocapsa marina]|uniref:hypothetical protein n=1 Tax=Thiohalocapsa marina TaxID=424902 RepID=UPI0036D88457
MSVYEPASPLPGIIAAGLPTVRLNTKTMDYTSTADGDALRSAISDAGTVHTTAVLGIAAVGKLLRTDAGAELSDSDLSAVGALIEMLAEAAHELHEQIAMLQDAVKHPAGVAATSIDSAPTEGA